MSGLKGKKNPHCLIVCSAKKYTMARCDVIFTLVSTWSTLFVGLSELNNKQQKKNNHYVIKIVINLRCYVHIFCVF